MLYRELPFVPKHRDGSSVNPKAYGPLPMRISFDIERWVALGM